MSDAAIAGVAVTTVIVGRWSSECHVGGGRRSWVVDGSKVGRVGVGLLVGWPLLREVGQGRGDTWGGHGRQWSQSISVCLTPIRVILNTIHSINDVNKINPTDLDVAGLKS